MPTADATSADGHLRAISASSRLQSQLNNETQRNKWTEQPHLSFFFLAFTAGAAAVLGLGSSRLPSALICHGAGSALPGGGTTMV